MMKRKFNRPEMKEHTILNFLENNALVEFPGLAGKSQEELEEITQDLLKTLTVQTVGGAFRGGKPIDLFGREAIKQEKLAARRREKEENKALGIENAYSDNEPKTVDDLRKIKERE